ncbi:Aste57867_19666 [Aphanomyces stellatus]|uniref:Aste57867_19666 protein n=1 Tax=Aphanomyces stellatus TaxID=120398 RepID=A0A485LD55_9STRA|nr:hypothetical protein As57867_019601 [Aphanomyces stellatus]VFT96366.1 Aste57867_19666 [Aphanomyces stellatus]
MLLSVSGSSEQNGPTWGEASASPSNHRSPKLRHDVTGKSQEEIVGAMAGTCDGAALRELTASCRVLDAVAVGVGIVVGVAIVGDAGIHIHHLAHFQWKRVNLRFQGFQAATDAPQSSMDRRPVELNVTELQYISRQPSDPGSDAASDSIDSESGFSFLQSPENAQGVELSPISAKLEFSNLANLHEMV